MMGEISSSIHHESLLLGISFLLGVILMAVYDVLRVLRLVLPHSDVAVSVEDMGYWFFCGMSVFVMLYEENSGAIRWFALAGTALGMLLWNKMISRWAVRFIAAVVNGVIRILHKLTAPLVRPAARLLEKYRIRRRHLLKWIKKQLKKVWKAFRIGLSKR